MQGIVIEDSSILRKNLIRRLSPYGEVFAAKGVVSAKEILNKEKCDFALIDLHLGRSEDQGLGLVKECSRKGIPNILVLTSFDDDPSMIKKCYSSGAHDFFSKDKVDKNFDPFIQSLLHKVNKDEINKIFEKEYITTDSNLINSVKTFGAPYLRDKPILITGPSGSGKTKLAEILHRISGLKGNLININSAGFSKSLLESELFGHVRGAFTGADKDKKGKLELADNGTLFLDEIANMPLELQEKILKGVEEKKFLPVGGSKEVHSNFRVISATKENILSLVKKNEFREDLYFRLSTLNLAVKPLSERKEDIRILIEKFLKDNIRKVAFDNITIDALINYEWPGNIRELKNLIEELSSREQGIIRLKDLPSRVVKNENIFTPTINDDSLTISQLNYARHKGLKKLIEKVEEELICDAFQKFNGKILDILVGLKISKNTFYRIEKRIPYLRGRRL